MEKPSVSRIGVLGSVMAAAAGMLGGFNHPLHESDDITIPKFHRRRGNPMQSWVRRFSLTDSRYIPGGPKANVNGSPARGNARQINEMADKWLAALKLRTVVKAEPWPTSITSLKKLTQKRRHVIRLELAELTARGGRA